MVGPLLWKKIRLEVKSQEIQRGSCRRRRGGRSILSGPKTKKAREPTVESLMQEIWKLRISDSERRVQLLDVKRDNESAPTKGEELTPAAPESNTLFRELDLVRCVLLQLVRKQYQGVRTLKKK